jgi:quercetin dioxygenase-like cupin family protein
MKIGKDLNALRSMYPCRAYVGAMPKIPLGASLYGYVDSGSFELTAATTDDGYRTQVGPGCTFALSEQGSYDSYAPIGWWVVRHGFTAPFVVTKPENKGRLTYIDGCSDSLLIYPPRQGDGSLSLLYFPCGIEQSWHTHPSIRLGYVLSGTGTAYWVDDKGKEHTEALTAGTAFLLPEHMRHRFCTDSSELRILAYHPDGDWGPTDHNHSMINRTYLDK